MKVKVHYLGLVKTYTSRAEEQREIKDDTKLSELFDQIAATYGKTFNEIYDPEKTEVKSTFMVLLNGIVIGQLDSLNTKLKDGDVVVIMPLVTGG
jgi:MoaD family protein